MMAKNCLLKIQIFQGLFFLFDSFHLCSVVISLSFQSTLIFLNQNKFLNETQVKSDHPNQNPIFNPDCGDLFASKNSALQQSHDKVDFHVLFQDKPRSLSFTTTRSLPLNSPSQLSFFLPASD